MGEQGCGTGAALSLFYGYGHTSINYLQSHNEPKMRLIIYVFQFVSRYFLSNRERFIH